MQCRLFQPRMPFDFHVLADCEHILVIDNQPFHVEQKEHKAWWAGIKEATQHFRDSIWLTAQCY